MKLKKRDELKEFRREVQMIYQDPYASLNPRMKVRDIIAEGIDINRLAKNEAERNKMVDDLLKTVGLNPNHGTRYPHEFSGGMRQRVMIAMALSCAPKVLIADEPTTALDVTIQAQIMDLLLDIREKTGTGIILITHDLGVVASVADKVAVMYAGQIVEKANVDDLFYHAHHPYTRGLLKSFPHLNLNKEDKYWQ